ncbi:ABC transporter permease [Meiothermus granaticius]|uniref:Dipeptide transport system permease protein DppB n=1 Tax=Meiothermus granaticius NBRC 107808 TaxID=1227551 RepID=A0A399FEE7_9DEIN|nr:ABC transporter permease [Meiothermus granaticius]MCL6527073.1 ABC transporter permease [Thermaceae bacterium]RIH93321.1 Dipeptide transport system permease protein DppB [Meiothermus granaticius NBRC 107808]GEM85872.1 peptide ABC transporter permease [Meiothermus granaticius NBRC 107808]
MNFPLYLARRILSSIPLLLGVSILLYGVLHLAPGGPLDVYADNPSVSPEALKNLERELGLDQPVPVQYLRWLGALLRGEWGYSIRSGRPVGLDISERIGPTLILGGSAFTLALLVALPLGILSALRRYSALDYSFTFLSFLGISMPIFWLALMLQALFAVRLHLLPSAGLETIGDGSFLDRLRHLILPACILAVANIASWGRFVRSSMLDVLGLDYIRTARAKGLSERVVVYRHALRNALVPVITIIALDFAGILSGAVVTETIFAWPGMGRLFIEAMNGRDYPVLMALLMIGSLALIATNVLTDLVYSLVDPRIRYE